jgi:hypothetical protein
MCRILKILSLSLLAVLSACQQLFVQPPDLPRRIESAVGGPERVFERPVTEIVPLLQNARASAPNGRVGSELVFWGYELEGGRPAVLVACAILPDVDCNARLSQVCPSGASETLFTHEEGGEVRHLDCQSIGIAAPGDLTPTCEDDSDVQPVAVTLLSCN